MSSIATPALDSRRPMTDAELDQLSINTICTLSIDAVQQAKSGHPDGARAPRLYPLESRHAFRSAGSDLAEPRSLRALQRPCFDAAVVGAPPDRHSRRECRI